MWVFNQKKAEKPICLRKWYLTVGVNATHTPPSSPVEDTRASKGY